MANVKYLEGVHQAAEIRQSLEIAYWLSDHSQDAATYHFEVAHRNFKALAEKLGYSVEKIPEVVAVDVDQVEAEEARRFDEYFVGL